MQPMELPPLSYGGLKIIQNPYMPTEKVKVAVDFRTFRERYFTLPWKPKELFKYEEIELHSMFIYNGMGICNPNTYYLIKNIGS